MDSWDNPAYDAALAYQKTAALTAAIKLNIVTLIAGGATTSDALAEKTGASGRGIRILCDLLAVMGLLTKQDGVYGVSEPARRYLDPSSPAWMGGSVDFYAAPEIERLVLDDPVSYVRNGGSSGLRISRPTTGSGSASPRLSPIARVAAKRAAVQLAQGRTRRQGAGRRGRTRILRDRAGEGFPKQS